MSTGTSEWVVEETGGGCQWLRNGRYAITDGEAGLPREGEACVLVTLDQNGDYEGEAKTFGSLAQAKAFVAGLVEEAL